MLIKNKKVNYYANVINNSTNASKGMWNVVNKERGKNNSPKINFTDILNNTDGNQFDTAKEAVNAMNFRFLNAAAACGAPNASVTSVRRTLLATHAPADRSLRLHTFAAEEVYRIVTTLKPPKQSKDVYGISMELVRMAIIPLAPILSLLFNICLKEGTFPSPLKISKVSPIFKGKGKRENIDGYRPVSIIPSIAKVFENGISRRLLNTIGLPTRVPRGTFHHVFNSRSHPPRDGRSRVQTAGGSVML